MNTFLTSKINLYIKLNKLLINYKVLKLSTELKIMLFFNRGTIYDQEDTENVKVIICVLS